MRIQHNIMAMNAYRNYNTNNSALSKNLEKLSSGYAINRAGDDAAGLAISEKMRAQITGLSTAQDNAQSGINLIQTAEGAMTEVHDMLNRMYELANQSANGTYDSIDREQLQKELEQLSTEIDRIADSTNFNGINLLDGNLTDKKASMDMASDAVDMTDGVTINAPVDGAGRNQTYDVTFGEDALFNEGDTVSFDIKSSTGLTQTLTFTFGASNITGADLKEQMTNLASQVSSTLAGNNMGYTATVNAAGDGITITANSTGQASYTIEKVDVSDNVTTVSVSNTTVGDFAGAGDSTDMQWDIFSGTDAGLSVASGDKLDFEFLVNGNTMTATLIAGVDFSLDGNTTGTVDTETIVNALQNKTFNDNTDTTAVDESAFKVSDYFKLYANSQDDGTTAATGVIGVSGTGAKYTDMAVGIGSIKLTKGTSGTTQTIAATSGGGATIGGNKNVVTVTFTNVQNSNKLGQGEDFTLSGTLADGRDFSITIEAGTNGLSNTDIATILNSGTAIVTIDGSTALASDIFGASGAFAVTAASGNAITITNSTSGTVGVGLNAQISTGNNTKIDKPVISANLELTAEGKEQSKSQNVLTFDESKIEQGTSITIDGKTYEFVKDANNVTNSNNIAVEIANLGSGATGEDIANALKTAIDKADTSDDGKYTSANNKNYTTKVDGNQLIIESEVIGQDAVALDVAMGDSKPSTTIKFSSTTMTTGLGGKAGVEVGDTVTINGKVYEFTSGNRTQDENAIAVDVANLGNGATIEDVANALASAVNSKDGAETIATVDSNGNVVLTSKYDANAPKGSTGYEAPEVEVPKGSVKLTLQIGDTSDDFNQLEVEINDMHADALGLSDIDISEQGGAKAAVDLIKEAINKVSDVRGTLGATQNRLEHTINNLSVAEENITAAESSIRDTDVAEEMMAYTKNNILIQSAQAMLAQANQVPQGVLQLLG